MVIKLIKNSGITLIELLVIVVILGLLALSSFLFIPNQIKKAKDARRKADLERIKVALYDYYIDSNCFPKSLPECGQNFTVDGVSYLNDFPCDPGGGSYGYQIENKECSQWIRLVVEVAVPKL